MGGDEKTEKYYKSWDILSNGQLSDGEYVDLFLQADAMIGDSISFMCEFSALDKPYLFTVRDNSVKNKFNELGKMAFNLLYNVTPESYNIESFIENVVIKNIDNKKQKRLDFIKNNLLPNNGKSASENIFEFILKRIKK